MAPKHDMKEALGGGKPILAHVSLALQYYTARAHQYGAQKYALGNYLRPPAVGDDVSRLLDYISAAQRHLAQWADSVIRFKGEGVKAVSDEKTAIYAADPESGLPHAAHAAASLSMCLQQAVDAGLMPIDPGITWTPKVEKVGKLGQGAIEKRKGVGCIPFGGFTPLNDLSNYQVGVDPAYKDHNYPAYYRWSGDQKPEVEYYKDIHSEAIYVWDGEFREPRKGEVYYSPVFKEPLTAYGGFTHGIENCRKILIRWNPEAKLYPSYKNSREFYVETGEHRLPKRGEYYHDGKQAWEAMFDFVESKEPIVKKVS